LKASSIGSAVGVLKVNGAGDVTVSFVALKPGFGYGMGWTPPPS
jgi:hypothetical protein